MDKQPCVYFLASGRNGTLYIGVTSALIKRVFLNLVDGFTWRYIVHNHVWYEVQLSPAPSTQLITCF